MNGGKLSSAKQVGDANSICVEFATNKSTTKAVRG